MVDGQEYRGEAVLVPGIAHRPGNDGRLVLKTFPGAQAHAQIGSAGLQPQLGHQRVRLLLRRRLEGEHRVGGQDGLWLVHPEALELGQAGVLPEGDGVHAGIEHPADQCHIPRTGHRPDAAAVHEHLAPPGPGGAQGEEIVQQAAPGGGVLDQAAAPVDIEPNPAHDTQYAGDIEHVQGGHAVAGGGLGGVTGEDGERLPARGGAGLPEDGLQDGLVAGVAQPVGAADQNPRALIRL